MHVTGRLMMASVGSTIVGSARSSNRMSRAPYNTAPCMSHLSFVRRLSDSLSLSHRVAGFLVEGVGLAYDVGLIHLLAPVVRVDFFERDRDRLVAVVQHLHHVVGDRLREPALLVLGFAGPQFHNHGRHGVTALRPARR